MEGNDKVLLILKAAKLAKKLHAGQTRKHGTPYFTHPAGVARRLWEAGHKNHNLIAAAYLHDVIEDTTATPEMVLREFGPAVHRLVMAVTKAKDENLPGYYARVKKAGEEAVCLKMADRAHNNSELCHLPAGDPTVEKARKKTEAMMSAFK